MPIERSLPLFASRMHALIPCQASTYSTILSHVRSDLIWVRSMVLFVFVSSMTWRASTTPFLPCWDSSIPPDPSPYPVLDKDLLPHPSRLLPLRSSSRFPVLFEAPCPLVSAGCVLAGEGSLTCTDEDLPPSLEWRSAGIDGSNGLGRTPRRSLLVRKADVQHQHRMRNATVSHFHWMTRIRWCGLDGPGRMQIHIHDPSHPQAWETTSS